MRWLVGLAMAVAARPAAADEVTLRTGERIEGRVTQTGDRVTVEVDWGTLTLRSGDITRIVLKPCALQEFLERRGKLDARDVAGRLELAAWARTRELYARERDVLREIVAIDPDHPAARAALGYSRVDGRWMTDDEVQQSKGLVRAGSRWVTPAEAAGIARREREEAAEAARLAEIAIAERKLDEARREADRLRAEVERLRWEALPRGSWRRPRHACP